MRFSNEQMASLAAQVFNFMTAASAPKAVAEKPKRRGNPEALAKARAVKAANAAAAKTPAKPAAESKKRRVTKAKASPVVGVDCGGGEFRKGLPTRSGSVYVNVYVEGQYAGGLRVDNPKVLKRALAAIRSRDAEAAIALACE